MRLHRPRGLHTRPTVSVVIPCYNYGHYLADAVASALDQRGLDVEVIVVDDASPDGSAEVARALAENDSRVQVLAHEQNAGHIRTYNDGLARARGDYLVLLSADDRLPRDALSRAVALMEHHPRVGLVYGHPDTFESEPAPAGDHAWSWTVWSGHAWLRRIAGTGQNVIMSPEVVVRRTAWERVGGYDTRLPHSADLAAWLRLAAGWDVGRVNGSVQAHYRVHGANMHLTTWVGALTDLRERRLAFDLLFAEEPGLPADAAVLHDRNRRALARAARRMSGSPAMSAGERGEMLAFAAETWPQGSTRPSIGTRLPLRRARTRVRETARYHRWRAVGW